MLRYAPLTDDSWTLSSPRIENPYKSSAYAPIKPAPPADTHDACHAYLRETYDRFGVAGLIEMMDGDMVRDIRASLGGAGHLAKPFQVSIGFEELAVLLVGLFLLLILMD